MVFIRAKTEESNAGKSLCATFVVAGGGPWPAATPQPSSSSHESNSGADADHSGPDTKSPRSPLGAFCADLNADAGGFFTPEVIEQATFISQPGIVVKDWIHFQAPLPHQFFFLVAEVGVAGVACLHRRLGHQNRTENGRNQQNYLEPLATSNICGLSLNHY